MDTVYNIEQARDWFLSHSSGSVICNDCNVVLEVDNYPDAKEFFENGLTPPQGE